MKYKKIMPAALAMTILFLGISFTTKPTEAVRLSEIKVDDFQDELRKLVVVGNENTSIGDWNEDGYMSVEDLYLYYEYGAEINGAGNIDLGGEQSAPILVKTECTKDSEYMYLTISPEYVLNASSCGYFDYAIGYDFSKLEFVEAKWEYEDMNLVRVAEKMDDYVAIAGIIKSASSSNECVEKIVTLKFAVKDTSASDKDITIYRDESVYGGDFEAMKKGKISWTTDMVGLGEVIRSYPTNIEAARETLKVALGIEKVVSDYTKFVMDVDGNGKIQLTDALAVLRDALGITRTNYIKSINGKASNATAFLYTDTEQKETEYKLLSNTEELEKYVESNACVEPKMVDKYKNNFEQYNLVAIKAPVYVESMRDTAVYTTFINNKNALVRVSSQKETDKSRQMIMFVQIPKNISYENINIDIINSLPDLQ